MTKRLVIAVLLLILATGPLLAQGGVEEVFDSLAKDFGASPAFVRVLTDNQDAWYARWNVLENGFFGRSFLGLLLRKAKEGVTVRLMLDARGTKMLTRRFFGQDLLQELAALPNVKVSVYNPVYKALLALPEDLRSGIASNHD